MTKENKMSRETTMSGILYKRLVKPNGGIPSAYFRPAAKVMAHILKKDMVIASWSHQEQTAFAAILIIWGQRSPQIIKREGLKFIEVLGASIYNQKELWSYLPQIAKNKIMQNNLIKDAKTSLFLFKDSFLPKIKVSSSKKTITLEEVKRAVLNIPVKAYEENLWNKHKNFKISYKKENVEILETPEMMYLDTLSDCCQGFGKLGSECMFDGVQNEKSGFVAFRDKNGDIFAQGWLREVDKTTLLIDSIEYKGKFRTSLQKDLLSFIKAMKSKYPTVAIGSTPNRTELFSILEKIAKRTNIGNQKRVISFVNKSGIYSDATRGLLFL